LDHLHAGKVSVREHTDLLRIRLAEQGNATFSELVADCEHTAEVVARFLALLELYREASIGFVQEDPLGELHVSWTGDADRGAAADTGNGESEDYG
jgi:segregation and condensation protein A